MGVRNMPEALKQLRKPDPKQCAREIGKRVPATLRALANANKGKYAERTGVSARILDRQNTR